MAEAFKRGDVVRLAGGGMGTIVGRLPVSGLGWSVREHVDGEQRFWDAGHLICVPDCDWRPEATRMDQAIVTERGRAFDLPFYYLAIAGEVGEACNLIKKIERDGPSLELRAKLASELADVRIYLHHILNRETTAFAALADEPRPKTWASLLQGGLWLFREVARLDARQRSAAQGVVRALRSLAAAIDVDLDAEVRVKIAELYARWPHVRDPEQFGRAR